jgi:DNA-binding transcriptional MerR regulator
MREQKYLTTSQVAKIIGVHPNTVRLYEQWGFLPEIPRSPSGYRRYTDFHVDQMRLARTALNSGWPGRAIRRSAVALARKTATGDLGGALEQAYQHLAIVQAERGQAEIAAQLVQRWADGLSTDATGHSLRIGDVARLLGITIDTLRNWERNGLIVVPHDPANGYRLYSQTEIGRLRIIRMLRNAGYSLMSILRMLDSLDRGESNDLRRVLDTPRPDEDIRYATDCWLSTLAEQEDRSQKIIAIIEGMIEKQVNPNSSLIP